MLVQIFEKLLRVSMIWVYLQRLIRHLVALLELALLKHQQTRIEARFEQVVRDLTCLYIVVLRLIYVPPSQL